MQKILFIMISLLLMSACFKAKNRVIPKDEMVEILARLHIGDAIKKDHVKRDLFDKPDSVNFQSGVLEEYGYDRADFDSTLKWYSHNPEKLHKVYQLVLAELSEMEAPLNERVPSKDTLIYIDTTHYTISKGNIPDSLNLRLPIPDMGIGEYEIRVMAEVYDDDQSVRPGLLLYREDQEPDEAYRERDHYRTYVKDGQKRTYTINATLRDTDRFTYFVDLLYSREPESLDRAHMEITKIRISFKP